MPHQTDLQSASESSVCCARADFLAGPRASGCSRISASSSRQHNEKNQHLVFSQRHFLVTIIVLQSIANFTETNTQITPRNIPLGFAAVARRRADVAANEDLRKIKQTQVAYGRFKLSPTRLRLTNGKSYFAQRTPARYNREDPVNAIKSFGRDEQSGKGRHQKAAYEFQSLLNETANQVRYLHDGWPALNLNIDKSVEHKREAKLEGDKTRNDLPKPWLFNLSEESKQLATRLRLPRDGNLGYAGRKIKRDDHQSDPSERPDPQSQEDEEDGEAVSELVSNSDSKLMEDYEAAPEDSKAPATSNVRLRSINLETVDDSNVVERSDTERSMSPSPVYPPGDLDVLYSDALLVYVKDFNQFINL